MKPTPLERPGGRKKLRKKFDLWKNEFIEFGLNT